MARRSPDAPALGGAEWSATYSELDAAANRIAHELGDRGLRPGNRVELLMRHDAPLLAAVLGAMKAGGVAAVLDARDPVARLDAIRAEVEPRLVVADERNRALAARGGAEVVVLERPDGAPHRAPRGMAGPDDLAALVYTSGTTARPKGVIHTHRTLLHNVLRQTAGLGIRPDDRIVLLASVGGGQGMATSWLALMNGACLQPYPPAERGLTGLSEWLARHGTTVLVASSSVFRAFARTLEGRPLPAVRLVRVGSEMTLREDFEAFRRHFAGEARFANALASSETGVIAQVVLGTDADPPPGPLTVGWAAEGVELALDGEEIVVRSEHLSPGYWRYPELTAAGFSGEGPERRFRSGDLGRFDAEGRLTVVGRADDRVKVRGSQVELAAVEAAVSARPEVEGAVVTAGTTARGDTGLTAFVRLRPGAAAGPGDLRRALARALPDHAVPAAFVRVEEFPLTRNGNVDREALRGLAPATPRDPGEAPLGDTERRLAGIWAKAFEIGEVGRDADFFELGGDSLHAAEIAAGVLSEFGVELQLGAFAETPAIREMAAVLERAGQAADPDGAPPLAVRPVSEPAPLSFAQEAIWRACEAGAGGLQTVANETQVRGRLDVEALRRAVNAVVARHEVLRTTFGERDGRVVQVVQSPEPIELPVVDLSGRSDADERKSELLARVARTPFDLDRGPLVRLRLVRLAADDHRLLRVHHHIISDAWSWALFTDELVDHYAAFVRGGPPPLPLAPPLQYGDYAAWERGWQRPDSPRFRAEVEWWRGRFEESLPPLRIPFARAVLREDARAADGVVWWGIEPDVSRELDRLSRRSGATYFMLHLAAFSVHMAVAGGQDAFSLGTYVTNRRRRELRRMFGIFTNKATLGLRLDGDPTFGEWLGSVRDLVTETTAHSEVPYEQLCARLRESGVEPPEIRAIFAVADQPPPRRGGGIELTTLRRRFEALDAMPWGFSFGPNRRYESERCRIEFDARIYDPAGARAFVERHKRLLSDVAADPGRRVRDLLRP